MSRSALTERFARYLGQSPMAYLADWRLELGAEALRTTSRSVLQIAAEVGYESEAAFNRAFKRRFGRPPAQYRRASREQRRRTGAAAGVSGLTRAPAPRRRRRSRSRPAGVRGRLRDRQHRPLDHRRLGDHQIERLRFREVAGVGLRQFAEGRAGAVAQALPADITGPALPAALARCRTPRNRGTCRRRHARRARPAPSSSCRSCGCRRWSRCVNVNRNSNLHRSTTTRERYSRSASAWAADGRAREPRTPSSTIS